MAHDDARTLVKLKLVDARGRGLTPEEIAFVANLIDADAQKFTARQAKTIDNIYERRVKAGKQ